MSINILVKYIIDSTDKSRFEYGDGDPVGYSNSSLPVVNEEACLTLNLTGLEAQECWRTYPFICSSSELSSTGWYPITVVCFAKQGKLNKGLFYGGEINLCSTHYYHLKIKLTKPAPYSYLST